jgi:hypothetical protein
MHTQKHAIAQTYINAEFCNQKRQSEVKLTSAM